MTPPRTVPPRDDKYLGLAFWMASFSKDPNTQMGAIIVGVRNEPLGWGYNGPPRGVPDNKINWSRPEKYDYIIHAEENAIDHSCGQLDGATLYVTGKPCKKCMLRIITTGISRVVYFPFKTSDKNSMFQNGDISDKTDEIARLGNVTLVEYKGNLNWMRDRLKAMREYGVFE